MSAEKRRAKTPSATRIVLQGLRARHGAAATCAAWERANGLSAGTLWAIVTRWAMRDRRPTGRQSDAVLARLCDDLPDATLRQLKTPLARDALARRAAATPRHNAA